MALADQFDGLLVDLDGVVWVGRELLPGAVETLAKLLEDGKEIVFVTNNSVKLPPAYAARLREAGIDAADDRDPHRGRGDGASWRPSGSARGDRLCDRRPRLQGDGRRRGG